MNENRPKSRRKFPRRVKPVVAAEFQPPEAMVKEMAAHMIRSGWKYYDTDLRAFARIFSEDALFLYCLFGHAFTTLSNPV